MTKARERSAPVPLLGAHMSVSGGIHTAYERGESIGCTTMQVFTKNANQWNGKPLGAEDIRAFRSTAGKSRIAPVVAHAAYLINLCAVNPAILARSRAAFVDELRRAEALGLLGVIFHPGSHMGAGEEAGIRLIAESVNIAHEQTPGFSTLTIVETTAGQGSAIGYRFEHMQKLFGLFTESGRCAICLDTCHAFASGYDIRTPEGWEQTLRQFDELIGLPRLAVVHVNDSKRELGSRVDRHEHIGKGALGPGCFRFLMNDDRFARIPKILETPKSEDMHEDVINLRKLKSFVRRSGESPA